MKTQTRMFSFPACTLAATMISLSVGFGEDALPVSPPPTAMANTPATDPSPKPVAKSAMTPAPTTEAATTATSKPADPALSFWTAEVVKLTRAGVDDDVVLSFLDNVGTFNLGADQIIQLKKQGVSREILAAMLQHDFEIGAGLRPMPTVPVSISPVTIFSTRSVPVADTSSTAVAAPVAAQPVAARAPSAPPEADDIDVPLPDEFGGYEPPVQAESSMAYGYPIRDPYPVKITEPIVIIRAAGRVPNVLLVQTTP